MRFVEEMGLNTQEKGEGRRWNASNVASFPSLFNIELMLSCVMKRSQTLRYSARGSSVGCCGFVWVHSYNAPLCLRRSASYGPILAHIPRHHPFTTRYAPGLQKLEEEAWVFLFFWAELGLLREKGPVWWPRGQIYLSCSLWWSFSSEPPEIWIMIDRQMPWYEWLKMVDSPLRNHLADFV